MRQTLSSAIHLVVHADSLPYRIPFDTGRLTCYDTCMYHDPPGNLVPVYRITRWLDMLMRSDLSPEHKLVGVVLSKANVFRRNYGVLTNTSVYSVSRILNFGMDECRDLIKDLEDYGWLWHSGKVEGTRTFYLMCVNIKPKEIRK